jgi:hypothetical protein
MRYELREKKHGGEWATFYTVHDRPQAVWRLLFLAHGLELLGRLRAIDFISPSIHGDLGCVESVEATLYSLVEVKS